MCIDVETTGLDWTSEQLHGVGIGIRTHNDYDINYYPANNIPEQIKQMLADPSIPKLGHNLHAFDAKFIRKAGLEIKGDFHDTMILAHLIDDEQSLHLKDLVNKYLGETNLESKRELDKYNKQHDCQHVGQLCAKDLVNPEHPHFEIISKYCKEDVNNTLQLMEEFFIKLQEMDKILKTAPFNFKKSPLDYYFEEAMPLEYVLFEIEYKGIRIDLKEVHKERDNALTKMAEIESSLSKILINRLPLVECDLYEEALKKAVTEKAKSKLISGQGKCKYSWSNNNHFGILLYKYCDLPLEAVQKTKRGKYKTDKIAIKVVKDNLPANHRLNHVLKLFSEYKLHSKIASTYTGNAKKGIISKLKISNGIHRIYPVYSQTTSTGRLKCKEPNTQNIKRDSEVKKFFIPENETEVFDDCDYSQIELRTGAHLSQDTNLLNAYRDEIDVHLLTASRLFKRLITKQDELERQAGKRTNFLTIFDGKAFKLQQSLLADTGKEFSIPQCKQFIKTWFELYPQVRIYLNTQLEFFKKHKFSITETGRIRRLPDISFGKDIKWFKINDGYFVPKYTGPETKRAALIAELQSKDKKLQPPDITEEMIGRLAQKKYDHAIKAGYNEPIQGLAASMAKRAMIRLHAEGRTIVNQVHDSLVVSRQRGDFAAQKQVIEIMENVYKLSLPIKVDCKTLKSFHPNDKVSG